MRWKLEDSGFKKINSTKKRPIVTHHVAHGPKRVNVRILPKEIKQEIVSHYNTWKLYFKTNHSEQIHKNAEGILDSITKYMLSGDYSDKLPEFVKFTKYLDQERGHSVLNIAPVYERLFE